MLRKKYGDKQIIAITDQGFPNKSAEKNNIIIRMLPAYSPNLNLIERFWKCLKQKVSYGQYY